LEKILTGLRVQSGSAPLHTLARYGYRLESSLASPQPVHVPSSQSSEGELVAAEIEDDAARAYVGRMLTPVTEDQAIHLGITSETAANLLDFILHAALLFIAAADERLTRPGASTEAEMQRALD
jgi:hypothetical protein